MKMSHLLFQKLMLKILKLIRELLQTLTVQLSKWLALKPIQKAFGLKRVIVSTYQAVSGAGAEATDELEEQSRSYLENEEMETNLLPVKGDKKHYPIAFNALPQIDMFTENGYTL